MKALGMRVEALEKRAPQSLVLVVPMADGTARKMSVKDFLKCNQEDLADPSRNHECVYPFQIVKGNNLKEVAKVLARLPQTWCFCGI